MQIVAFRIRKYRNIEDSGEVELASSLTCIVGKNQSGKSSLLKALHKFNPHDPSPYDVRREWPRGQRTQQNKAQVVCEVKFQLTPEERTHLRRLSWVALKEQMPESVWITKNYAGEFGLRCDGPPDFFPDALNPEDVAKAIEGLNSATNLGPAFGQEMSRCVSEAFEFFKSRKFDDLDELQEDHVQRLEALHSTEPSRRGSEEQFLNGYVSRLKEIASQLAKRETPLGAATAYLSKRIPTFIYMDDYRTFKGQASLLELKRRVDQRGKQLPDEHDETFLMILKLAGLSLEKLIEQGQSSDQLTLHDRQLDLHDAAKTLTKRVAGRWGQNNYRIMFLADGQTFFTEIEETDKSVGMIPLEEQSKGFQWFFSFDLHFMHDSNGKFEGCVLLLDEPGLHLHPGAQADLLKRLDAYSEKNTTIYTTHLPFLIDLREPARIRVIAASGESATVTADLGASQKDERLTLQAALGMRANQSFLVARRNLVVEGVDDYWIVTELSNVLERMGEPGLPDDVMVTAAGSASDIVHQATFMIGQGLEVVALFDSDDAGRREEEHLRKKWLLSYKNCRAKALMLGAATGGDKAVVTIEDVLPRHFYVDCVKRSHDAKIRGLGSPMPEIVIEPNGPILQAVKRRAESIGLQFNKGQAARLVRRELIKLRNFDAPLSAETLKLARSLFASIRGAFGEPSGLDGDASKQG